MLNFEKNVSKIGGWLTKEEGEFLYQVAKNTPQTGNIVEIGSWKGRSTICFGLGAKGGNGCTIYAIDSHTGSSEHRKWFGKVNTYREFLNNIKNAGTEQYVIPIKETSENTAKEFNKSVRFVLVDGAHEYKSVKLDYNLWFPKLVNSGLIAFHDCWHAPGVHFFTTQLLLTSNKIRNPRLLDTLTIVEKIEKNTSMDRIRNALFVIYRLLTGWLGTLKMDKYGTSLK